MNIGCELFVYLIPIRCYRQSVCGQTHEQANSIGSLASVVLAPPANALYERRPNCGTTSGYFHTPVAVIHRDPQAGLYVVVDNRLISEGVGLAHNGIAQTAQKARQPER